MLGWAALSFTIGLHCSRPKPPELFQSEPISAFTSLVEKHFQEHRVVGGALAVLRGDSIVFSKGFGYADKEERSPFTPNTVCRTASISKCITGVAVLRLVQKGKLSLDTRVFDVLPMKDYVLDVAMVDPRVRQITLRHLLWQRSGLESQKHLVWANRWTAAAVGAKLPMSPRHLVQFALREPLVCDPGADYHYGNLNFVLARELVEKITGSYERFVQEEIWRPCGVQDASLCSAHPKDRRETECAYYDLAQKTDESALVEDGGRSAPLAYGGGGDYGATQDMWVVSVTDLAKFMWGVFRTNRILDDKTRTLIAQPYPGTKPERGYCGAAFNVEHIDTNSGPLYAFSHGGEMHGACGFVAGRFNGTFMIVLSNTSDSAGKTELDQYPAMRLIQPLHDLADKVRW